MNIRRPLVAIIALVPLTLVSLFSLLVLFEPTRVPPLFYLTVPALGAIGLFGALGMWLMTRWGWWLSILVSALGILWTIPGLFLPPTLGGKAISLGVIVFYALALILSALPVTRRAIAARASTIQA